MKQVVIVSGNPLSRNPRVFKEASSLAAAGFDVEVLGRLVGSADEEEDRALALSGGFTYIPVIRPSAGARLRRRLAWAAFQFVGAEWPSALGYDVHRLLREARKRRAELFIAHSEPAMWVVAMLAREGRRVGIDMEDWYSEDLPPHIHRSRPARLLRALEAELLRNASHRTCPSQAMSKALADRYGCSPPRVVYNAFPLAERNAIDGRRVDRSNPGKTCLHWYSQTLGSGRGLEDLLAALPLITQPVELHLRGLVAPDFRAYFEARIPTQWRDSVFVHGLVPNRDLMSRIAEHDIGLALEMRQPPSRDLTVTNKIMHYMLAGLPIVASDTAGQSEIATRAAGAVRLYRSGDPRSLAEAINELVVSPGKREAAKAAALEAAHREFCWERQVPTLIHSVKNALEGNINGAS